MNDCSCQWMFALFLQRIGNCQKFRFTPAIYRNHIRNLRFSLCNRSGFIQCHNLCFPGFLQRYSRLKENTVFGAHSVADHDGNRCSKAKCTRTTDNQHRNSSCQSKTNCMTGDKPYDNGYHRNYNNSRNKYTGNLVCNFCNRCLCCSSITYHLNDLRKSSVLTDSCSFTANKA